ncbi:Threonine/homoserine/homoserine lactone efflux protein [Leifsonia sp. 98AMF]|uniref:GAP family protein n=1 Tax=unclassified Leifsonia TaxID=2663824 RepID=UPI00087A1D77|nr:MULTISPECIES: GAP family protein [unclassified Leifsonia]SDH35129.1 Threonine/homoserine/homoserine lactone efflux protein [Leifsonia sp. 197AMF]SDJ00442.1 Threonine/homoserine/homoserine lactone efflux protein [Leifsonia sp. 466MF]SDJ73779.1 Threonine/homoserine/homoserine lactone efflux protein [Leifsonia sp. 157MF]SDO03766.1 Threonine/homoserine/homoserine lactone efflux protein [Leifsonia sp. 509MF]SEN00226.1 Threonine/homoserine/homoserine lactone efflux protein [Leifsonia sp. 467MF]
MGPVIGDVIPLALGVAISPIPIIAAILMLLSPKARGTSLGFLLGWLLGIVVAVVVFTLLSSVLPQGDPDESKPILGTVEIVLGLLLLVLAVQQWRGRPKVGTEPALPKWMSAIDTMTGARALVLGFLLSALNPKNLLMGVAAGVAIGSDAQTTAETVVAVIVYTVIAASTVAIPVIAYLAASARMARPLESLRTWLVYNNATIMAVLLLVIGVVLIGKGLGEF